MLHSIRVIEWIARRERAVAATGLGLIIGLAWLWLFSFAGPRLDMSAMRAMSPPDALDWSTRHALIVFAMWAVMMPAMMLPSAAPTILLFAAIMRARATTSTIPPTGLFAAGYVLAWTGFSLVATAMHWGLERAALLSPAVQSTSAVLGGLLLVAAGLYQLTPLKRSCLRRCRSPLEFLFHHWRPGRLGALRMGLSHGVSCVGCCWALMGLLFVGGAMNPLWVAAMAVFVLLEKTAFLGTRFGPMASGAGLVAAGALLLAIA